MNPILLDLLLPVGISFYTFQTLSYVIDVYKGVVKAEHHFGYYAAFISFFPQLVAGPIERTNNLLPQIKAEHIFNYDQATYGLKLMAWGYLKKIVIADSLAQFVGKVYDVPQGFYDYAFDERFSNSYNLFFNSDHLNKEGARLFTNILMDETVNQ